MSPAIEIPKIISVDDHVVEPPHVWDTWLPARYRDRGATSSTTPSPCKSPSAMLLRKPVP